MPCEKMWSSTIIDKVRTVYNEKSKLEGLRKIKEENLMKKIRQRKVVQ